jgi:hypothetical protein
LEWRQESAERQSRDNIGLHVLPQQGTNERREDEKKAKPR